MEDKVVSLKSLNKYLSEKDNCETFVYESKVPDLCKQFPCVLGIDEAGRGPVLGPMVYGIAYCPINRVIELENLGCADSKTLTEEKRDGIFTNILQTNNMLGWAVEVISPNTICNNMLARSKHSLNQVSMDAAIGLIRCAEASGANLSAIYVDTVGPPEKYQAYLKSLFPKYDITVAKKADSTYTIVSAASICAKVVRDHALQVWTFQEGLDVTHKDFGSGYPGDPVTKKFLNKYSDPIFGFPKLVRFSWSTASKLLDENAFMVEWEECEEESQAKSKNTVSVASFFKVNKNENKEKHKFFKQRCLQNETEF